MSQQEDSAINVLAQQIIRAVQLVTEPLRRRIDELEKRVKQLENKKGSKNS